MWQHHADRYNATCNLCGAPGTSSTMRHWFQACPVVMLAATVIAGVGIDYDTLWHIAKARNPETIGTMVSEVYVSQVQRGQRTTDEPQGGPQHDAAVGTIVSGTARLLQATWDHTPNKHRTADIPVYLAERGLQTGGEASAKPRQAAQR